VDSRLGEARAHQVVRDREHRCQKRFNEQHGRDRSGRVLASDNLHRAWAAVKANAGAGGVDGKGIGETERHLETHWPGIREKLLRGDYRPAAVRGVEIAKPDGGTRQLGIPTVQDRLIQQALHQGDFLKNLYRCMR
jgi:retron-type reverse transcriptase